MIEVGQALEPRAQVASWRLRRALPWVLVSLDAILVFSAFVLAYFVRYSLHFGPKIQERVSFNEYEPVAFLLVAIMMPVLFAKGAYRIRMSTDFVDEIALVFSAATITVASLIVITALRHQYQYSRGVVIYVWILVIVLVSLGRGVYRAIQGVMHRRGLGVSRVLVVGASNVGKMVMQSIMSRPDLGYHLVGFVDHRPAAVVRDFGRFRAHGTVADLPEMIAGGVVDEVILALPASAHEEVWPILSLCEQHGVGLKIVPDLFEMSLSRVRVDDIAGIPLLDVQERPLRRFARGAKRLIDIVVALMLLVLALPFFPLIALLIRLESRGPALLCQERVGIRGPFPCWKFRTMFVDAHKMQPALQSMNETDGPIFKLRDDPRCTRIGKRLRRGSLDEIPQLWNVLKGEMSLVGPRPPLPSEVAQYEPWHHRRLEVKPGLTGLWQVSGRSDLQFDEMVMMDIFYVDNWSLALDFRILIRTVIAVLAGHGAY